MGNDRGSAEHTATRSGVRRPEPVRPADRHLPPVPPSAPGRNRALGVSMLAVLALGLLFSALNPALFTPGDARLETVLTGDWMAGYQTEYERGLPIRDWAVNAWGLLQYGLFREGRPGVLVGENDWLYTSEEFARHREGERLIEHHARLVAEVRERLARRGIELVVALVPAKARIYPERLGRYRLPEYTAERYRRFRSALLAEGVPAPDLKQALLEAKNGRQVFLRTDTHWTPEGARVAARALAEAVEPVLEERAAPRRRFVAEAVGERTYAGDLTAFLPVVPFRGQVPAEPDRVRQYRIEDRDPPEIGLFDEVPHPVTLVGTSYSAGEVWDFEGALRVELQAEVLNLAEEGRGPFAPMEAYLSGEAVAEVPPEVVVWEIPERYVTTAGPF